MKNKKVNITEIWKDIKGYEGLYQVSNMGRVKSLERTIGNMRGQKRHWKERILKQRPTRNGYLQVTSAISVARGKLLAFIVLFAKLFTKIPKTSLV